MTRHFVVVLVVIALVAYSGGAMQIIASASFFGETCHGANRFNNAPLSDFVAMASTFANVGHAAFWTSSPFTPGFSFGIREMGVDDNGVFGPALATTPLSSPVVTWFSPEAIALFGVNLTESKWDGRVNVTYDEVKTHTDMTYDFNDIESVSPSNTGKLFPAEVARDNVTLASWNLANGDIKLKCFEHNGLVTGNVQIRAFALIPDMLYTVWSISAGSELDSIAPIFPTMAGGMTSAIVTDRHGDVTFDRQLAYCPLDLVDPIMYFALAAHPDGIIHGSQPFGGSNPFPIGGDQLCFNVAHHALSKYITT